MARKSFSALVIIIGAVWALLTIHPMPAQSAPATDVHTTLPACTHEDGSGQALCYWDAQVQGNGMGTDVIAGDCSIGTVGDMVTSAWCLTLWAQPAIVTYLEDGAVSELSEGKVLVDDCLTIEWEARNDNAIRETLNNDGWNLAECFKAHIE